MRSILITGCSSGIGYAAAKTLSQRGWRVFATCRKEEDCRRLIDEGLWSCRLDYEDPPSIAAAWAQVAAETDGRLDALFNNGAYAIPGLLEDLPTDGLRAIFEANVFGWHELTRLVVPVMRDQGHGRIVQNSSILGFNALMYRGAYNATKFAIEGLSDTLRLELHGSGVEVALIEPGPIDTKFRQNCQLPFKRWIDWQSSRHKDFYEQKLIPRLEAESLVTRFELPADAVVQKLIHAVEARRPNPRYYVTLPTYVMGIARRFLSTRRLDLLSRAASG
ncbi:MAG TPA: SDR family NAD(P)-dependent oxidoreductase [Kiloniellaceae bacterium]|nr:SDR family NAD(P)-dependent oxidoreductase [Kiloniellaceae bacterium]